MSYLDDCKRKGLNVMQIREVEQALKHGLTTSQCDLFAKSEYDNLQMKEIRLALEHGLTEQQMAVFLNPAIDYEAMNHARIKIESGNVIDETKKAELSSKRLKNTFIFGIILLVIAAIVFIVILSWKDIDAWLTPLQLELTDERVSIEYGHPFNAADYIKSYTSENTTLSLPSLDTDSLGVKKVIYTISNEKRSITKELTVIVVDKTPPVLTLKQTSVTLYRNEDIFVPADYIESAYDEIDGDLFYEVMITNEVDTSLDEQSINYMVMDSKGNVATATLTLILKDRPKYVDDSTVRNNGGYSGGGNTSNKDDDHGVMYFMFEDGFDIDTAYYACLAYGRNKPSYTCTPIIDWETTFYTGYMLEW